MRSQKCEEIKQKMQQKPWFMNSHAYSNTLGIAFFISRPDSINYLNQLGFERNYAGSKHQRTNSLDSII
ncbi:hypothetical protein OSCI_1000042 [Kamptonema sp. PCC 6506]|nr:hypothetical protein OSCI_1000042 [Kamptonema sp. PCC 6506]